MLMVVTREEETTIVNKIIEIYESKVIRSVTLNDNLVHAVLAKQKKATKNTN